MIQITANARCATYTTDDLVTSGSIGIPVRFELSGEFDGTPYANDDEVLSLNRAVGNVSVWGAEKTEELFFSTNGTAQEGDYVDMLTFTVNIVGGQVIIDDPSTPTPP